MPEPLYERPVRAVADGTRLEVLGSPAGPAGVSAVELPDGSVWEVDHARPERLVGLDVETIADPTDSALLVAAFGGDGALFVADASGRPGDVDNDVVESWEWASGRGRSRGVEWPAEQAGRLVLLADLADDDDLPPIARVAAAAEFAAALDDEIPGGDVLAPLVPALLGAADELAADVGPEDVDGLDPALRLRLDAVLRGLVENGGSAKVGLGRLAELLAGPALQQRVAAGGQVVDASGSIHDGIDLVAIKAAPVAPPPTGEVEVTLTGPGFADIRAARSGRERWVRVSRSDGLVLVAQSRLHRDGLVDRAEVAVPESLGVGDLVVRVVDVEGLPRPRGSFDMVRAAVRAGRRAAQASRLGQPRVAAKRWEQCSRLWEQVGDADRARLAREFADPNSSRSRATAPLADELAAAGPAVH